MDALSIGMRAEIEHTANTAGTAIGAQAAISALSGFTAPVAPVPHAQRPGLALMHPPSRPSRQPPGQPKFALVLGSGGVRISAALGLVEVLTQEGLAPDLVVGCSAGALFGALIAAGHPAADAIRLATTLCRPRSRGAVAGVPSRRCFGRAWRASGPTSRCATIASCASV